MLKILDVNSNALEVEVIRYFKLNNTSYFMYTLNEADEQNYLKLYAVRINSFLQSEKIENETEWASVKEEIKTIIKGNKEGSLSVEDLDYNELTNIKTAEPRAFKLSAQLVDLLKANKKDFPKVEEINSFEMPEIELPKEESFDDLFNTNSVQKEEIAKPVVPVVEEIQPAVITEPDYSFENEAEEIPEENHIAELPEEVEEEYKPIPFESEDEPLLENNYKILYEEEKELTEVLKGEIAELREKLNQITQVLSK